MNKGLTFINSVIVTLMLFCIIGMMAESFNDNTPIIFWGIGYFTGIFVGWVNGYINN